MERKVEIRDTGVGVTEVLDLVGEGKSLEQILKSKPNLNSDDIRQCARFASDVIKGYVTSEETIVITGPTIYRKVGDRFINVSRVRKEHPRAFEKWKANEDNQLVDLFKRGEKIEQIAQVHRRKPGAIRARLQKLGLIE